MTAINTALHVQAGRRRITAIKSKCSIDFNAETTFELDSHADTCVLGRDALIIQDFERPVDVFSYDHSKAPESYRTVSGVVKYHHPLTGERFHLIVHQAIHVPHLDHHLLCPMQCRVNDVTVNDLPKFLAADPTEETHALVFQVDSTDDGPARTVTLPLELSGITSVINVSVPTADEFNERKCTRLELTSEHLPWDPYDSAFEEQEKAMTDCHGDIIDSRANARGRSLVISALSTIPEAADIDDDENLATILQSKVVISSVDTGKSTSGIVRTKTKKPVDAQTLARRWGISPDHAQATIDRTTQLMVRTCLYPTLSRRYSTNDRLCRYRRLQHMMFSDTGFSNVQSQRGNKCCQFYASGGWARAFPMRVKSEAHDSLSLVFQRDGVPPAMILDGSKEQVCGMFRRKLKEAACQLRQTEPYSPWQQAAEGAIREIKRCSSRMMLTTRSPKVLWDHSIELAALIRSHTASEIFSANGEVPETIMTGDTADISRLCQFAWYDWLMFRDAQASYPDDTIVLGRYLGPAIDTGPAHTAKILKQNGQVVYRSTYRHLTPDELERPEHIALRAEFDAAITAKLGPAASRDDYAPEDLTPDPSDPDDDDDSLLGDQLSDIDETPTPEVGDNYLQAELLFPRGNEMARGKVISRKRDADGNTVGRAHNNPILDTRMYNVEFEDGDVAELTANAIAISMYTQCDPDGNQYLLFDSFVGHRKDDTALTIDQQSKTEPSGRVRRRKTTKGWQMCCQWKDGSTSWEELNSLRNSYPTILAEYAVAHGIDKEPAFNWWVPYTLKRREAIISATRSRTARYLKKTHKFGIEVPKSVEDALRIDNENGNHFWRDAIAKEMKEVRAAFKILDDNAPDPVGYQKIRCHMIFDVKMEDFRRKARLVAGGHVTKAPATITFASVVSRETVRLALMLAALNDLEVKTGDVLNAYITAPITEKVWTVLGPEFGPDAGKRAVIVRALYGLKSAGAAFRAHLAQCMRDMGYTSCRADPDLWYKPMTRPHDDYQYYAYILCYVDDILVIHHDAMSVLRRIDQFLPLKPSSVGDPDIYLGTKLKQLKLDNGLWAWGMSPSKYVQQAVANCEQHLKANFGGRYHLTQRAENPFKPSDNYEPELDVSEPLTPELASYFQSIIGVMRWMIEIGRVDIATEVSLLSSHLALPREGHLNAALHIMSYLKCHHNSRIVFDPSYPDIDYDSFPACDWKEFYGDVEEAIPDKVPQPLGREVDLRMYVDSDHAGDKSTRRSRTGMLIYCNSALIEWVSKKQPTVESSVFGAEFVAMKFGIEKLRALRYKLRMMGVPISGASYVYGDNLSVVTNAQKPESQLRKKNNAICYHAVRESVAMGECLVTHVRTQDNLADVLTKVLFGGKRRDLVGRILYDIFDHRRGKTTKPCD